MPRDPKSETCAMLINELERLTDAAIETKKVKPVGNAVISQCLVNSYLAQSARRPAVIQAAIDRIKTV